MNGRVLAFAVSLAILAFLALYIFFRCLCRPGARFKVRRWESHGVVIFQDNEDISYRVYDCKSLMSYMYQLFFWRDFTCYNIPDAVVTLGRKSSLQNQSCAICLKTFSVVDKVLTLNCKHGFHGNCIMPWLTSNNSHTTCPLCARSVKLNEIRNYVTSSREGVSNSV